MQSTPVTAEQLEAVAEQAVAQCLQQKDLAQDASNQQDEEVADNEADKQTTGTDKSSKQPALSCYLQARQQFMQLFKQQQQQPALNSGCISALGDDDVSNVVVVFAGVETGRVEVTLRARRSSDALFISGRIQGSCNW